MNSKTAKLLKGYAKVKICRFHKSGRCFPARLKVWWHGLDGRERRFERNVIVDFIIRRSKELQEVLNDGQAGKKTAN